MTPRGAIEATVVGDARTRCVWIRGAGNGKRYAALWPAGYRVRFAPLRIHDDSGRVVWREGVPRTLGGGPSSVHVDRIPRACRVGDTAWWTASLS